MIVLRRIFQHATTQPLRRVRHAWSATSSPSATERRTTCQPSTPFREFSSSRSLGVKQLPPRPKINEDDIIENFLKGSGPGGQKINKTSVAVQLLHKPTGLVVKCQHTRSRTQNRTIARKLLGDKLDELEKGPESRKAIKAETERKKKASKTKKANRKYKAGAEVEDEDEGGEAGIGEVVAEEGEAGSADIPVETKIAVEEALPEWERKWRELRGIK